MPKPPRVDGRRLRSERTKQLIIEAFLALLREDPVMPTAVQIAEKAGYSVRSIFERFPDLVALRVAATDYALAQALALAPARYVDGDRHSRLKSQVETRAFTCERGIALWRVLLGTRMHEMHGLSFEEACAVWVNAIDRMLPPTPTK